MLIRFLQVAALLVKSGEPTGSIALSDQYEHSWNLSDLRGSVVFLVNSDNEGSKYSNAWGRASRERYKDQIKIVYVANLSSVPGLMRGWIRGKFVSKDPAHPKGSVLLDWKGEVAQRFGFRLNLANVYVVDREGLLRYSGAGQGSQKDLDPLFEVLDRLLGAKR